MTNQLSHPNFFPDFSKLTLRRVFKTDQGWTIEADGQDSAVCPGCQSVSRSRHSRYWASDSKWTKTNVKPVRNRSFSSGKGDAPAWGNTREAAIRPNKPSTFAGELPFSILALALS